MASHHKWDTVNQGFLAKEGRLNSPRMKYLETTLLGGAWLNIDSLSTRSLVVATEECCHGVGWLTFRS